MKIDKAGLELMKIHKTNTGHGMKTEGDQVWCDTCQFATFDNAEKLTDKNIESARRPW